jgi:hypothetical protein
LRDDDDAVLRSIQSYWQCGTLHHGKPHPNVRNAKPTLVYNVTAITILIKTIIPHFDQFPLRSKKARDFLIWRQCVMIMYSVQQRPHIGHGGLGRGRPGLGWNGKWTAEDREEMRQLESLLVSQRRY